MLLLVINYGKAQGAYYTGVDLTLEGIPLKNELAGHISSTHNNFLSYNEVWNVLKQSDLQPENSNNVLLIYGYNDNDGQFISDYTRSKNFNGGSVGTWNREHTYPKSRGTPNLGTSGPGADAHHLRSCDMQMNSARNNHKFVNGSGVANYNGTGWYPGDEWKGDCARMMMYMYLRYGSRCLPSNVGIGNANSADNQMIDLFLSWNAEDPVSEYEQLRNDVVEDEQGNRNPFIDNPAIATAIWGGPEAEDPWNLLGGIEINLNLRALLQGPYDESSQLMRDDLRSDNKISFNEPYSAMGYNVASETITPAQLAVSGEDAIVDWILVEIRDPDDPTIIVNTKVGLLQRDGDIVNSQDNGSLVFTVEDLEEVIVAIRHRNHFGVRTSTPVSSSNIITLDFTDPNIAVYGLEARVQVGNKSLLIAGDANGDGAINVIDKNNFWRLQNAQVYDYNTFRSDFNLDGTVNAFDKNGYWRLNNSRIEQLD